jgi:hypothetical protein
MDAIRGTANDLSGRFASDETLHDSDDSAGDYGGFYSIPAVRFVIRAAFQAVELAVYSLVLSEAAKAEE